MLIELYLVAWLISTSIGAPFTVLFLPLQLSSMNYFDRQREYIKGKVIIGVLLTVFIIAIYMIDKLLFGFALKEWVEGLHK